MKLALASLVVPTIGALSGKREPDLDVPCSKVQCVDVECRAPFKKVEAEESGTCCAICDTDSVDAPEDRSWTDGLTGGIGMDNNADPVLCKGVMCPELGCQEFEQSFDGRCCRRCASAASNIGPAEFAKKYDDMK